MKTTLLSRDTETLVPVSSLSEESIDSKFVNQGDSFLTLGVYHKLCPLPLNMFRHLGSLLT